MTAISEGSGSEGQELGVEPRLIRMAPIWIRAERWLQLWRSLLFCFFLLVLLAVSRRYLSPQAPFSTILHGLLITAMLLRFSLAWFFPRLEWQRCRYEIHGDRLVIHRGVWTRRIQTIPRSRIQHIELNQGPLARRYGLSVLSLNTAGTHFARISLPGLPSEAARVLRDELVEDSQNAR